MADRPIDVPVGPVPPLEQRSLIDSMRRWRDEAPDRTALVLPAQGVEFTYRELYEDVARIAAGLRALGLEAGDRVAMMLRNSPEYVLVWLGCEYAGLIDVNIDPVSTGRTLTHLLTITRPRLIVCDDDATPRADAVAPSAPSVQWLCNVQGRVRPRAPSLSAIQWRDVTAAPIAPDPLEPTVTTSIRFTSGTTGPSKGVGFTDSQMAVLSSQYVWLGGHGPEDRLYSPFPLHHALSSVNGVGAMLRIGGTCVLDDRFRPTEFWTRIRSSEATATQILRALIGLLLVQPESPHDRDHQCRRAQWCPPNEKFASRFGLTLVDAYGMSEGGFICYTPPGERPPDGAVGRPSPLYDVRIVDEHDAEVRLGELGELVWRPRRPHAMMTGYFGDPEATVHAWRNLWYHTGDQARLGPDGFVRLIGRIGDQIRRKGVNIPAEPIEVAAREYPGVSMAAAIAVPSALGESEVKLCVRYERTAPDLTAFMAFLIERLPRDSIPRYVEFRTSLPLSSGNKVRKFELREEGDHGITPQTIDVESLNTGPAPSVTTRRCPLLR